MDNNNLVNKEDNIEEESEYGTMSVFLKQSEIPKYKCKLCYQSIIENIPEPYYKKPDIIKRKELIEWRWRFYNIENKKIAEISFYDPTSNKRLYVNSVGDYVERDIPEIYNQYIIDEYYYYSSE
jgi:hypothetical protein